MKLYPILLTTVISLALLAGSTTAQPQARKDTAEGIAFFEKKIRPVLVKSCYKCHSTAADKSRGELTLDTKAGIRKGGESGDGIVPGDLKASLVYTAIRYEDKFLQMPPNEQLPAAVIADFARWIEMGAPDPRDGKQIAKKDWDAATDLWCLQPIQNPAIPKVANSAWPKSDVDRLLLARMEKEGLEPVGDAEPLALLRRLHFDLVGLPPSPEEMASFLREYDANKQTAVENLVDRLLASNHFGERWGRHWLDVVRFAESNGKERDVIFPHAWRYRHYVIDAFNADKPFDRFITEQIAGDLLPAANADERNELLIATGFLALGPKSFMKKGKGFEMDLIDDQIDTTSRAFLGLTVSCARCHDHKFDPIPTKDYYSLGSIFASTKTLYGSNQKNNSNLQTLGGFTSVDPKEQAATKAKMAELTKQMKILTARLEKVKADNKNPNLVKNTQKKLVETQGELQTLKQSVGGTTEFCMAVEDAPKPTDLRILIRGELNQPGDFAPRGFLSSIKLEKPIAIAPKNSGRLELAHWLTDPGNPLTARVAVNRIWQHLFGQGIVRSVDNFGVNGEEPSHPELLDHLATQFIADGWSYKKMIRAIVLSRTYQLDTTYHDKNYEIDPDNRFLWRRSLRRLDVEAIRDSILAASGKLDLTPPEKSRVTEVGQGEVGRGINMKPIEAPFYNRSVYMPILRSAVPEILKVFDFAEPSLVVGKRNITTIPAQALFLMNNAFVLDNAGAMADRVTKSTLSDADRIQLAHKLALGRLPTDAETKRAQDFLNRFDEVLQQQHKNPDTRSRLVWTSYCQALFASAEFRYQN
jgi:hypothetical protein